LETGEKWWEVEKSGKEWRLGEEDVGRVILCPTGKPNGIGASSEIP